MGLNLLGLATLMIHSSQFGELCSINFRSIQDISRTSVAMPFLSAFMSRAAVVGEIFRVSVRKSEGRRHPGYA
jgi:hypothetical protein